MPADAVGGARYDISLPHGSTPTDQRLEAVFDKAFDASMPEFAKMNLAGGLSNFSQNFNDAYTKSSSSGWTAGSFPNPCLSPAQCGVGNRTEAYICDPDSVLKPEQRQRVNTEFR